MKIQAARKSSLILPALLFGIISTGPVTGYAATGVPVAIDSIMTKPKVSVFDGKTKTSASAKCLDNSLPNLAPKK